MSGEAASTPPTGGIFISKGMRVGIPPGGFKLSISDTGEVVPGSPVAEALIEIYRFRDLAVLSAQSEASTVAGWRPNPQIQPQAGVGQTLHTAPPSSWPNGGSVGLCGR